MSAHSERAFYSDIEFPDQHYGVLIRSSIQRGRLVDMKIPSLPDGYFVYTATDIPGENKLTAMGTSIPVFAPYEINYFGEPLGIVVGPDLDVVLELVSEVLIEAEPLEPLGFGDQFSSSQVVAKRVLISGDPDQAFSGDRRVFETESEIGPQDHYYAEPLGVNVSVSKDRLEIYTATQWPFHVRAAVSSVLDLDPSEILVIPTVTGESMDGKIWFPSLLAAQASLAAVLSKKPVKIAFSRQEDFLFSVKSAPVRIRYRTAIADDGSVDAAIVRILVNSGAYSPLIDEIVERMTVSAIGLYMAKSYRVETYALKTNLPPMGALSGWGEGQVAFALETHLARVISELGLDPVHWKMMNVNIAGHDSPLGRETLKDARIEGLFDTVCAKSDFLRKYSAYELLNRSRSGFRDGPLRGIGIVCGFQGNGFAGTRPQASSYTVEVTMETDGQVRIKCGFNSDSMRRIITAIAAKELGIEEALISLTGTDTESMPMAGPDTLSSKTTIIAPLVEKCCATVQKQRFRHPLPLSAKKSWKPAAKEGPFVSVTPGVAACELELDPITFEARIRGLWIACDGGTLYDPRVAHSAVAKTVPLAISKMTVEHLVLRDGKISPKQSVQYEMLSPANQSDCDVTVAESGAPPRGIGSVAMNLVPAAYAAALGQITGNIVSRMPVDPETLYDLLGRREEEA